MARRVQTLNQTEYNQKLKLRFNNKIILTQHSQILTKLSYRPPQNSDYKIRSWAKFDSVNFNGMQLIGGLFLQNSSRICNTCTFKIYSVSTDDMWTETLVTTISGTSISNNRFKAIVPQNLLNPLELTGELTFKVEIELTRFNNTFKDFFYVNHLGVYSSIIELKQAIDFLNITKQDI